jgi:hypothetical protein
MQTEATEAALMPFVPIAALLAAAFLLHADVASAQLSTDERQALVAERGRNVMPFDLERTVHAFIKTPEGGIQRVTSKNAGAASEIAAIRRHLAQIADAFRQRDFRDPRSIHGDAMPGLAVLERATPEQFGVADAMIDYGAEIRYTSGDPAVVAAIHAWFDAQLGDHGHHAHGGSR